jgi:hypothetical protein
VLFAALKVKSESVIPVTFEWLKRLKASAKTSRFIFSLKWKRFERRRSTVAVLGRLALPRGTKKVRWGPPDPSRPLEAPPVGLAEMNPVTGLPEERLTIGEIRKSLKIA